MVFGIPVIGLLSLLCTVLGAYMLGSWAVKRYHVRRRENERAQRTADRVEVGVDYIAGVYADLKDPETQKARVQRMGSVVRDVLKNSGMKLAEQFECSETAPAAEVKVSTEAIL